MIKYRTCNICEALCGLAIEVEDNKVISIKGDQEDVFSEGHICPKAYALKDVHEDPDRLHYPMRKINGSWVQVSWEEAINYTAERLVALQTKYGNDTIGIYQGNPTVHNAGSLLFSGNLVRSLKTKNRYSATSLDQLPHHLAADFMFGNQFLIPVPDIKRTDFWLILGGNPLVSNGSLMTAPDVGGKLKAIQARGGQVIVVDPRKTRTARKADQHLFIRPGTDIWLLLALLHHTLSQDQIHLKRAADFIKPSQIEAIKEALKEYTPAYAASITGISEDKIIALAETFLAAPSAICYGRLGVSITEHGSLCHWAINLLNILSGNFAEPGGVLFTNPAIDVARSKSPKKRFGRWHSRVRGLPEYGGELPSATLAEDILEPGEGQIRGFITSCGNPVLSATNGQKVDQALDGLEFMVSVDIYLNETTRHADVILPPATGLETAHLGIAFHNLAIHNTVNYSDPVLDKPANTLFDWEIFNRLTKAVEEAKAKRQGTEVPKKLRPTLEQVLDQLLTIGPHPYRLKDLKAQPHGIDLGPLAVEDLSDKLQTEDRLIDLFPTIYQKALLELSPPHFDPDQMLLIGRRDLRSMNSWLHNSYRMVKGKQICVAQIHPSDASRHNINNGDLVEIQSRVNRIEITAEISEEVGPGTISIPHGWGHRKAGVRLRVAEQHAGVSYNDLADEQHIDRVSGNAALNAIPVRIVGVKVD
ncbi:MAG: molybdopterin oxidoreductase family protein [Saprospiraceae bacterium]